MVVVVGGVVVVDFLGDIGVVAVGVIDCHSYYHNRMMTKLLYHNTNDTILNTSSIVLFVVTILVVVVVENGIRISSVSYVYNPGWTFESMANSFLLSVYFIVCL